VTDQQEPRLRIMRCRSIRYLSAAVLFGACERVTAPKAIEIADDFEHRLRQNWTPSSIGAVQPDGGLLDLWISFTDRSTMLVSTDGGTEPLQVLVVERVFVSPNGQGTPVSRRALVAWPQNTSYGILAVTQSDADDEHGLSESGHDDVRRAVGR
jgi:hypothetical protein